MKVIALQAANIKALRAVDITPTDNLVQIVGENGAGKSSVLDCIFYALAGKKALPSKPVRRGQDSALITLDLGDVKVTRKFSGDDKTEVFVEAQSGARFPSPQRLLDDLLGELSFDPLKFALAEPKAQLETLRGLVKLDVDIEALDGQNLADYELRRDWNRKIASLKDRVATLGDGLDAEMIMERIDVESLTEQMATASEHNAGIEQRRANRARVAQTVEDRRTVAQQKRDAAAVLLEEAAALEAAASSDQEKLETAEPLPEPIDVSDLRIRINEGMRENALREQQARQRAAHKAALDELTAATTESEKLTERMETRTKQRQDAIAKAKMPVKGLTFGDGEVLYNKIPFTQASSAERIRVSFAIAMAANPKLRVALIRDGSLLDDRNLAAIAEMAAENDFQVFVERVDAHGKVGILIRDGEVASVDGVPVPVAAAAGR